MKFVSVQMSSPITTLLRNGATQLLNTPLTIALTEWQTLSLGSSVLAFEVDLTAVPCC